MIKTKHKIHPGLPDSHPAQLEVYGPGGMSVGPSDNIPVVWIPQWTFGEMMLALQDGDVCTRLKWAGKRWIFMKGRAIMHHRDGYQELWYPIQEDLLATDWEPSDGTTERANTTADGSSAEPSG